MVPEFQKVSLWDYCYSHIVTEWRLQTVTMYTVSVFIVTLWQDWCTLKVLQTVLGAVKAFLTLQVINIPSQTYMEMEVSDEVQFYCKVLQVPSMSCIHTSKHYKVRLHSCIWVQNYIKQKNYGAKFCSDLQLVYLNFCSSFVEAPPMTMHAQHLEVQIKKLNFSSAIDCRTLDCKSTKPQPLNLMFKICTTTL
jgi:hypothetical protein